MSPPAGRRERPCDALEVRGLCRSPPWRRCRWGSRSSAPVSAGSARRSSTEVPGDSFPRVMRDSLARALDEVLSSRELAARFGRGGPAQATRAVRCRPDGGRDDRRLRRGACAESRDLRRVAAGTRRSGRGSASWAPAASPAATRRICSSSRTWKSSRVADPVVERAEGDRRPLRGEWYPDHVAMLGRGAAGRALHLRATACAWRARARRPSRPACLSSSRSR